MKINLLMACHLMVLLVIISTNQAYAQQIESYKPAKFNFTVSLASCLSSKNVDVTQYTYQETLIQIVNNCGDGLVLVAAFYIQRPPSSAGPVPAIWISSSNAEFKGKPLLNRGDYWGQFVSDMLSNDPNSEGKNVFAVGCYPKATEYCKDCDDPDKFGEMMGRRPPETDKRPYKKHDSPSFEDPCTQAAYLLWRTITEKEMDPIKAMKELGFESVISGLK